MNVESPPLLLLRLCLWLWKDTFIRESAMMHLLSSSIKGAFDM